MGLLTGKNIVITGVLTDASLAFGVAKLAQEEGANIVLTGAGRGLSLTQRTARKLPQPAPVFELDVTVPEHLVSHGFIRKLDNQCGSKPAFVGFTVIRQRRVHGANH